MTLKTCPFCGGEAKPWIKHGDYRYLEDSFHIQCRECSAQVVSFESMGVAENMWNLRKFSRRKRSIYLSEGLIDNIALLIWKSIGNEKADPFIWRPEAKAILKMVEDSLANKS